MDEIRIGSHVLQPSIQLLLDGEHVHLGPRVLSILTVLAEADGKVVTKDHLMEAVWPDVTVEENNLQVQMTALRKALGKDAILLHTLRGVGYRLEVGEGTLDKAVAVAGGDSIAPSDEVKERKRLIVGRTPQPQLIATVLGVVALFVTLVSIAAIRPFHEDLHSTKPPNLIAVLPLNVSGDEELRSWGQALTTSISIKLARVPNIELASETATENVAGQGLSPSEIGGRLGVDHLIEGSVLAAEERLVSQVRLIEAQSERAIWSSEIVAEPQDPDELEAKILNRISGILLALQSVANGRVLIPEDIDPRAYRAYLDGLALMSSGSSADRARVLSQMRIATTIEPDFGAAHAGLAYNLASGTNHSFSMGSDEYAEMQTSALERALSLNPDDFMARLAGGYVALNTRGDVAEGLRIANELLVERPEDGKAHALLALALRYAGRYQEAVTHVDHAIAADPFNYGLHSFRRRILVDMGDYFGVMQSARDCRVDCWLAALDWWESLSRDGGTGDYRRHIEEIARMFDDQRAFSTGEQARSESILGHGRFVFLGEPNPFMEEYPSYTSQDSLPLSHWALMLFQYGYVDAAFRAVMKDIDRAPAEDILLLLEDNRMTPSREIRSDPRYHELFEIPRFKAVADYRRENGRTAGLPVFPVRPFNAD